MSARPGSLARATLPIGARSVVLLVILIAGLLAMWGLGLGPGDLVPREGGWGVTRRFFAAALRPALTYEADWVPDGTRPFLLTVAAAVGRTLGFAAGALSLSLLLALPLALLASDTFWSPELFGRGRIGALARPIQAAFRAFIAVLRSVHELLWAVVLLAALGFSSATAVIAIAIPYTGILAKVFSEMIDEAPRSSSNALLGLGAGRCATLALGLVPRALPDLLAYAFYRFECAVRSSAVLGFFGYETIGYYVQLSFGELHYREVWTHLYALLALVLPLEAGSGGLRRRMVG